MSKNKNKTRKTKEEEPGYPHYDPQADIYNKGVKEKAVDVEELSGENSVASSRKKKKEEDITPLLKDEAMAVPGIASDELDIPGGELDDEKEEIGSEDEENNYYSLGGDQHEDLEEDKA